MARRPKHLKKSVKLQVERLQRKCRYCKAHQARQGFDKHEAWCKKIWMIRQELLGLRSHSTTNQIQTEPIPSISPILPSTPVHFDTNNEFVEGSSSSAIPMSIGVNHFLAESESQEDSTLTPSRKGMLTASQSLLFHPENFRPYAGCVWTSFTKGIH
jgi:hypothetical protein